MTAGGAFRHSCGAYVVQSARYGLYDADSARHHFCLNQELAASDREVWDVCLDCAQPWIKVGNGPRLHPRTRELHECPPPSPPVPLARVPIPARQESVEPPGPGPSIAHIGLEIPE